MRAACQAIFCIIAIVCLTRCSSHSTTIPAADRTPSASSPVAKSKPSRQRELLTQALRHAASRRYQAAASLLQEARLLSRQQGDLTTARSALCNLAAVQMLFFRYRDAMKNFLACRQEAQLAGDKVSLGSVELNLSSLYYTFAAYTEAEQALERAERILLSNGDGPYKLHILMQKARLRARAGRFHDAVSLYRMAIAEADRRLDWQLLAQACDQLGLLWMEAGDLTAAETIIISGYRIRRLLKRDRLISSFYTLGKLYLAAHKPDLALRMFDHALEASRLVPSEFHTLHIRHGRARALALLGRTAEAWRESLTAIRDLRDWRMEVLPADAALSSTGTRVQDIYTLAVESGAKLLAERGDSGLAGLTFEIAESNRASALQALSTWRERLDADLPAEYTELLAQLRAVQTSLLVKDNPEGRRQLAQIKHRLTEIEASGLLEAGPSRFPFQPVPLAEIQRSLAPDEALLSFLTAPTHTYLWVVTREGIQLHRLAGSPLLERRMNAWLKALHGNRPESTGLAERVYQDLFGSLGPQLLRKSHWLLALDGFLFRLPFAALVNGRGSQRPRYLVESHSLQIVPAAGLLRKNRIKPSLAREHQGRVPAGSAGAAAPFTPSKESRQSWNGPLLGVYDPVYNRADARLADLPATQQSANTPLGLAFLTASRRPPVSATQLTELPRLPGTRREWEACSRIWRGAGRESIGLEGPQARWEQVVRALGKQPSALHFATHLVPSPDSPFHSWIALSRCPGEGAQFCSADQLRAIRLRSRLVVLSGCSSGAGQADPGEGLRGLTRAWLLAGATSVAASLWATPDDSGRLWQEFYRALLASGVDATWRPGAALRQAQLRMLGSGGWHSNPNYWGAYIVVGSD